MSELNHGLAAADPQPKDFGWDAPYVTIDDLVPLEYCHPDAEMRAVMEGVIGVLHGVDVIWRDILRQERMMTARGCADRRAGHLAIYAKKGRQRRKNWKRVLRTTVEEARELFLI